MSAIYKLDRSRSKLFDDKGRCFAAQQRAWVPASTAATGEEVDGVAAVAWLQKTGGAALRIPVGVIGPREAPEVQLAAAERVGRGIATMGLALICGGRQGIMEAACRGAQAAGGISIGLLPDADPAFANPHASIVIATGIGEARNALIARASLCLVVIGNSFGTLSEVALGRQFGKRVIGLQGAADVDGVIHVECVEQALGEVARCVLGII